MAILVLGAGGSGYYISQGLDAEHWTNAIRQVLAPGSTFAGALEDERRLTMAVLAGDRSAAPALATARSTTTNTLLTLQSQPDSLAAIDPGELVSQAATYGPLFARLPIVRQQVDNMAIAPIDAYKFYGQLTGLALAGMDVIAHTAPFASTSVEEARAREVFDTAESVSKVAALSGFAVAHGPLPQAQLTEFIHEVGYYHTESTDLLNYLTGDTNARLHALVTSPEWQRLSLLENAILQRGTGGTSTNTTGNSSTTGTGNSTNGNSTNSTNGTDAVDQTNDLAAWQADATKVATELLDLYQAQQNHALNTASDSSAATMRNSILAAVVILSTALVTLLAALWLSDRLTRRLKQLRRETLALADEQLPQIMSRLRSGESVDVDRDLRKLQYGDDEIGQVGDAFNRAQLAAVTAAVTEAKTREGVKSVFVNIARRSQVMMHRLLEILDEAERDTQNSPAQLDMLYRLDHLATRERRNAENLTILGGERPGRRWHSAVNLDEIVRGAVAETQDYHKVHTVTLPELAIVGGVVTDVVHLLAELIDNATSFSPPQARVDVSGGIVGRGVVVEISDQGLGMGEEQLDRINQTLASPPDFSVDTLSTDSRLGLFVVARLAQQNEITVRLTESDYGGIRAIVVIPSKLIAGDQDRAAPPAQQTAPAAEHRDNAPAGRN